MINTFDLDRVNHFVLRKQHLSDDSKIDDVVQIVKDIGGLHATGPMGPYLSLFVRTHNFKREDLDEELYVKRNLGKVRYVRGTLYVLPKEMVPTAFAAIKEIVEKGSTKYLEYRGVSSEKYKEISKIILNILQGKETSTSEIKKILKKELDVSSIINQMCDEGLLIRSRQVKGWKDRRYKYALFQEYFPKMDLSRMSEMEAITQIVQSYLSSFGPVTENDITWWTGLSKTKIREALNNIQDQIFQVKISNFKNNFIMLRSDEETMASPIFSKDKIVNLLPSLDPYLMGYRERERYLDYKHFDEVFDRSGNATTTILLDGRFIGIWDFTEDPEPIVKLFLFDEFDNKVLSKIFSEAEKIGKFIADKEVKIKECNSMVPLTSRTAGGVMSPLKDC